MKIGVDTSLAYIIVSYLKAPLRSGSVQKRFTDWVTLEDRLDCIVPQNMYIVMLCNNVCAYIETRRYIEQLPMYSVSKG